MGYNGVSLLKNFRAIVLKSVKRFSGKNCGKNEELEQSVEPSETKTALEISGLFSSSQ